MNAAVVLLGGLLLLGAAGGIDPATQTPARAVPGESGAVAGV